MNKLIHQALEAYCRDGNPKHLQYAMRVCLMFHALDKMAEQPSQKCSYPYCGCNSKAWCKVERNEALAKMAENAREVGLDYEPAQQEPEQPAQTEVIAGRTIKVDWKAQALELRELVRLGGIKIAELEAALAEQPAQQEPVGYWQGEFSKDGGATLYEVPQESMFGRKYRNIPLYDRPQAREPLTGEQITEVIDKMPHGIRGWISDWDLYEFTRAIEAVHGIKGDA